MTRDLEHFELLNTSSQLRRAAQHAFEFYGEAIPLAECQEVVTESHDLLARTAKIKHHLVPLAERWSIDRLRRLGILANRLSHGALEVLFVDHHDTATAPMAAALLTGYARGRVNADSAGHSPGDAVHPAAVEAMADTGIDLGQAFPKPLTPDALQAADVIILLDDVPEPTDLADPVSQRRAVAGRQVRRWDVDDLAACGSLTATAVQDARDDLDHRVLLLLADLLSPHRPSPPPPAPQP
ncbi:hypothetical protein OHR68_03055 [Spirillospora sp. NBC_00431]